jgi:hypothetical protein
VQRMPPNWFGIETLPVLEELCRNICYTRDLTAWLDRVDPTTMAREEATKYKFLASRYARCASLVALLSNRLRLTVISQRDVRNSRAAFGTNPMSPDKPWDEDEGESPLAS